jgi:hypothetical protein
LIVVGADFSPIEVTPLQLTSGSRTNSRLGDGSPADTEDTLQFAELAGVRAMIETYPLEKTVPRRVDDVRSVWLSRLRSLGTTELFSEDVCAAFRSLR